ncbi:hypothetical protein [Actinomadura sp. HBU206391]|uniref:hypothetical protein n=1 Tax=Actinomadura sp. HBU206391 TaxID=2731692 RepID=UPI001650393F|nr:hypothetical protein [Actinomadura sp. HBU206391]MBC6456988.1 hypothetical protein [Actinomadura sp. HBU206391]
MTSDIVERLYRAFADVRRPARVEGCPCCVEPDADRPLLTRPLRALTAQDLSRYGAKALNTWGGADDFRYFAPRLLELSTAGDLDWPDIEIVFGKLAQAGWPQWPQRRAIEEFMAAFWSDTLARHPRRPRIDAVLCALGCAGADLAVRLTEWEELAGEPPVRHLHELATSELTWSRGRPRLRNAFWDTTGPQYREVIDWLTGGAAAAAVSAAFARADSEERLGLLAEIDQALAG